MENVHGRWLQSAWAGTYQYPVLMCPKTGGNLLWTLRSGMRPFRIYISYHPSFWISLTCEHWPHACSLRQNLFLDAGIIGSCILADAPLSKASKPLNPKPLNPKPRRQALSVSQVTPQLHAEVRLRELQLKAQHGTIHASSRANDFSVLLC